MQFRSGFGPSRLGIGSGNREGSIAVSIRGGASEPAEDGRANPGRTGCPGWVDSARSRRDRAWPAPATLPANGPSARRGIGTPQGWAGRPVIDGFCCWHRFLPRLVRSFAGPSHVTGPIDRSGKGAGGGKGSASWAPRKARHSYRARWCRKDVAGTRGLQPKDGDVSRWCGHRAIGVTG